MYVHIYIYYFNKYMIRNAKNDYLYLIRSFIYIYTYMLVEYT